MVKNIKEPHRVINFLEMIGTFIGARLFAIGHNNPDELRWTDFDIITDNIGNKFIINKCFTSCRPVAWALHELIALSLDKSIRFNATFKGGESGELSQKTDQISRGLLQLEANLRVFPNLFHKSFWFTDIRKKSLENFSKIIRLKDRKRLIKKIRRAKGGGEATVIPRMPKGLKADRKRKKKLREMQLSLITDKELKQMKSNPQIASLSKGGPSRADLDNAAKIWAEHGFDIKSSLND